MTAKITSGFDIRQLPGNPGEKSALLIAPPIYDTQYWGQWSQPYGLLRIAALLKKHRYKRLELFDFMEVKTGARIHQHRINPGESFAEKSEPERPVQPHRITKPGDPDVLDLFRYHFGKTWQEFEDWLDNKELTSADPPEEIWISAVMTYWWESVRDLIVRLRQRFGKKSLIILGGIYPTLVPRHTAEFAKPDIVVVGEVVEANDLWTDLSLYETPPAYVILTPSRGCPFDCAYCAQKTINHGRTAVHVRTPDDVYAEMRDKWERYGIRDFAFYADFLLWRFEKNFIPLLEQVAATKDVFFRLHAPEGLDVKLLSQSQRLVDLLKEAHFQKIYLPCESIDDEFVNTLNRKHVRLEHFVKAVRMCENAGFRLRNMDINAFVLYGLPGETVDRVVKTILFVSEIVGSIIPMLFTPVPSTVLFQQYLPYIRSHGWHRELHMLNGKLYPFLEMNEGLVRDYVDMQRLMFTLNAHYRNESFQMFGESQVAEAFRENLRNGFERFVLQHKDGDILQSTITADCQV
ncbi:MAG: B12-binding domain-containing radical SAM protein [Chloroflexota bacterium]